MSYVMRRRRSGGETAAVSLFPFLAVLICTMGALIVLLVVTVQQAGNASSGSPEPIAVEDESDPLQLNTDTGALAELQRVKEDMMWQAENLIASRGTTLARLKEQQVQLSVAEDQSYELQNQLTRLQEEVELLKRSAREKDDKNGGEERLLQLQSELVQAKRELEHAQIEAKDRHGRFTIVPHTGLNGTNRRPLYVECQPDKVVLQPEGIVLATTDFRTPMGPENPLASALRAKREFLLNAGAVSSSGEPYPLLIVRPGAERAYAACRDALTGWDEEFGYELIPADMKLAYPPVDQMLVGFMEKIIDQVRARRELVAVSDKPSGGVVMGISHEAGGFVPTEPARGEATAIRTSAPSSNNSEPTTPGAARFRDQSMAANRQLDAATSTVHELKGTRDSSENSKATDNTDQNDTSVDRDGSFPAARNENGAVSDLGIVQVGSYELTTNDSQDKGQSHVKFAAGSHDEADGGNGGAELIQSGIGNETGSEQGSGAAQMSFSVAKTQGQNWALPNDTAGAIGVVRPVFMTCTENELILHPDNRKGEEQAHIRFAVTTKSALQPFVGLLWDRIEDWGVAGNGMYWQPLLKCEVGPDGEERFHEFAALLHGSGLEIQRR